MAIASLTSAFRRSEPEALSCIASSRKLTLRYNRSCICTRVSITKWKQHSRKGWVLVLVGKTSKMETAGIRHCQGLILA